MTNQTPAPTGWRLVGLVLLTFASGAAYESGCVFWVHYSENSDIPRAVTFSCFNAFVTIIGVESFLKSKACAVAFIAGYGFGTFVALSLRGTV